MPCWRLAHLETELFICADKLCEQASIQEVRSLRLELDTYIAVNPQFLKSLTPVEPERNAPETVKSMCRAAKCADVGPMAAVAGAFCAHVGCEILKTSEQVIVENGGDIFIKTDKPKTVAVFAGSSPLSLKVGIVVDSREMPMAVCTSSGTVGPSLSFGKADAAVVVSPNAYLADACATRLGNEVTCAADIERALEVIMRVPGVTGAMAIVGDVCGAVGEILLKTL